MKKKVKGFKKIYNRRIFVYADGFVICHISLNDKKKNKLLRKNTKHYLS